MKSSSLKISFVLPGALLFNIIFWQEKLALNVVFFDAFILAAVFYLYRFSFKKPVMKWLLLAHLITLAAVVIHNTVLSKLAFSSTLLLVIVFTQYEHRSLWYAFASAVMNYVQVIPSFKAGLVQMKKSKYSFYRTSRALRFIVIPVIMLIIFSLLYNSSNAVFHDVLNIVITAVANFFGRFFDWFSLSRFIFFLLGVFITGGLLLKSRTDRFSERDTAQDDVLWRKKNNLKKWKKSYRYNLLELLMGRFSNGILALRNENTVGIISLVLLNLLLFFINWLDIVYVWIGFNYDQSINLTNYVHEGAGLLIFSILLAMLVLLFFFRGNLNFYKNSKWLRLGAYCWIIQNTVLVVSVLLRDYYYIHQFGLAYKRIGVLVFLLLTLAGLFTVFIKIRWLKTNYFLLKVNAWVVLVVMVMASCIHWDEIIVSYNLARKNSLVLDIKFLLSLSDKALPVIENNQDILERPFSTNPLNDEGEGLYRGTISARDYFLIRKRNFFQEQETYSWLSWNEADHYVKQHLPQPVKLAAVHH